MSRTPGAGKYRALLIDAPVRRTFALAMLGRLGYAVFPLSFMFTASQSSGSFATGAAAISLFGLAGLVMPVQARLMDTHGQRKVLPSFGTAFLIAMTLTALMAHARVASPVAWYAVALGAGLSAPSLGPAMRAQWRAFTTEKTRPTAYSLDAVAEETVFLAGPVIAAGFLAVGPAWHATVLATVLVPLGVVGLALSPASGAVPVATRAPGERGGGRTGLLGPLRRGRFLLLLLVMMGGGFAGALHLTAVAGLAEGAGRPSVTGLVEAACGALAVLGGVWWGRQARASTWAVDLAVVSLLRGGLLLGCALVPTLWPVSAALVLAGLLLSPWFVSAFTAGDQLSDPAQHTEASTWVTTAMNVGTSLGAAAAGWAVVSDQLPAGFFFAAVAVLGSAALCRVLISGSATVRNL